MIAFVLFFTTALCGVLKQNSQHGFYYFNDGGTSYTSFTSINVWKIHNTGDPVYLATEFFTNLNLGYFGLATGRAFPWGETVKSQFSIWHHQDINGRVTANAFVDPGAPWCKPFGNEGSGIHCDIKITLQKGVNYQFEVRRTATGNGYTLWECYMWANGQNGKVVGKIRLMDVAGVASNYLKPLGISFMEYFQGSFNFETGAGWTGPFLNSQAGPKQCDADCAMGYVDACIPGMTCGYPHIYFNIGGSRRGCSTNIWNQSGAKKNMTAITNSKIDTGYGNPKAWSKIMYEMWNQPPNFNVTKFEGKPTFNYEKFLLKREEHMKADSGYGNSKLETKILYEMWDDEEKPNVDVLKHFGKQEQKQ